MTGRVHVNTHAVQVMPIVPVNARTKVIARWWGSAGPSRWSGFGDVVPHLRVRVWEPLGMGAKLVASWTVTYP